MIALAIRYWWAIVIAALLALVGVQTLRLSNLQASVATADKQRAEDATKRSEAARETERFLQRDRTRIDDEKTAAVRDIGSRLADTQRMLRNRRPDRLPDAALAACAGTSARELARPDAEAFARYAADARGLQVALEACEDREWSVWQSLTTKP